MTMGAIHAAHLRRLREEDEMTGYGSDDLAEDWEFKIVRSATSAFGDPANLRLMLEEESVAGWRLLEKLGDDRVRLKRPAAARERDELLPKGVDPYRTTWGWSDGRLVLTILLGTVGIGLLIAGLAALLGNLLG